MKQYVRYIGAIISIALTLACIAWLYGTEFKYSNTEEGRLAAVTDYVPKGIPTVEAWDTYEDQLLIYYTACDNEMIHGFAQLRKGLNGKYQIISADYRAMKYMAGVEGIRLNLQHSDADLFALIGKYDDAISKVDIEYSIINTTREKVIKNIESFEVSNDFFAVMEQKEMVERIGVEYREYDTIYFENMKLYDVDGNDITSKYSSGATSHSVGVKAKAELFMLYVYIGFIALVGLFITGFILAKE